MLTLRGCLGGGTSMVSGVLKMGFYVKHKVVTKAKRKKSIVTTEESTLVPGYEHVGEEIGAPESAAPHHGNIHAGQATNVTRELPD